VSNRSSRATATLTQLLTIVEHDSLIFWGFIPAGCFVAKQHLLLVDADNKSLRVMEVSLKKAGFSVTTAINGQDALEKVRISPPNLIISDTKMPEMDGFEFCRQVKADERFGQIPFVFLTNQKAVEYKVKGLELGVDDYLTKPIYIKEIVTRVKILLQKKEAQRLDRDKKEGKGFSGSLSDMGVVDLVQTFEIGRKSGTIHVQFNGKDAKVYFRDGKVIDAETGKFGAEAAFYRLLNASDGTFDIEFAPVDRPERIVASTQGLLMEGMRRLDEWGRMLEQIPPLESVFEVDYKLLAERLAEIPDEVNEVLRLFDGKRNIERVVDDCPFDDLVTLGIISKLYFEGIVGEPKKMETAPAEAEVDRWLQVASTQPPRVIPPPAAEIIPEVPASASAAVAAAASAALSQEAVAADSPPSSPPPAVINETSVPVASAPSEHVGENSSQWFAPPPQGPQTLTTTSTPANVIFFPPRHGATRSAPTETASDSVTHSDGVVPELPPPAPPPHMTEEAVIQAAVAAEDAADQTEEAHREEQEVSMDTESSWAPAPPWLAPPDRSHRAKLSEGSTPATAKSSSADGDVFFGASGAEPPPSSPLAILLRQRPAPPPPPEVKPIALEEAVEPVPEPKQIETTPPAKPISELFADVEEVPQAGSVPIFGGAAAEDAGEEVSDAAVVEERAPNATPDLPTEPAPPPPAPFPEEAIVRPRPVLWYLLAAAIAVGTCAVILVRATRTSHEEGTETAPSQEMKPNEATSAPPVSGVENAAQTENVPSETKPSESKPGEPAHTEGKPVETSPTEVVAVGEKPPEAKPAEAATGVEPKPLEAAKPESKPAPESKPVEVATPEQKPPPSATDETKPGHLPEPSAADLDQQYKRLLAMARSKESRNRPRDAAADYKKALAIKPESTEALLGAGIALVDVSAKEAVNFLDRGLAKDPHNARALVALGMAQQTLGKNSAAQTAYQKYLQLYPNGDYADEIRAILQNLK
jgi:CheY-like chemotaxis protein